MLLVKAPVPLPLVVWESVIVGAELVLQQTPRAVTGGPPLLITKPPEVAVVPAILVIGFVVTSTLVKLRIARIAVVYTSPALGEPLA
jgi:hypothetical protein